jgi:antibiotic biosynthesis monooxygenase (ABM) superfamily enzyme
VGSGDEVEWHPPVAEPVTVTVARRIAPGREADFEEWSADLTRAASVFPGYLGAGMLRPGHVGDPWHVVFRFDSAEHLATWESSPERRTLLTAGEELVHSTDMHRISGLETWFALPGRTAPAPPRWKMFVVSAGAIYVLNLLVNLAYGWSVAKWPVPPRLAVVSVPVTALMTWVVMPRVARLLRNWLYAPSRRS